jgi:hypothetical protein
MAFGGRSQFDKHIGYYLIDAGRRDLEQAVNYCPTFLQKVRSLIKTYPTSLYIGGIFVLTLLLEGVLLNFLLSHGASVASLLFLFALSFVPVSEISIQFLNLLLTQILRPYELPKMSYENEIAPENKTLVVIPTILSSLETIEEEIHRLEIRFLANNDANLYFGIFSDFSDASQQQTEEDSVLLEKMILGIKNLEKKYGSGRFFLFHRQRTFSNSEKAWIGWERKRGKLETLNRLLMGETLPENIHYVGEKEKLNGIRYVITLDTDTQLPKNTARELVAVITHPLNSPVLAQDG